MGSGRTTGDKGLVLKGPTRLRRKETSTRLLTDAPLGFATMRPTGTTWRWSRPWVYGFLTLKEQMVLGIPRTTVVKRENSPCEQRRLA